MDSELEDRSMKAKLVKRLLMSPKLIQTSCPGTSYFRELRDLANEITGPFSVILEKLKNGVK